jgi:membrane protein DedA with SNARE-associated domain
MVVGYPAGRDPAILRGLMLAFLDQIVIPFLTNLYGSFGYLGVLVASAIESAMIPLPSELILPFAGFLVSNKAAIEPLTNGPWNFWLVCIAATIGNVIGSLIAYAIGAWGGRPFLERYGRYLLIRPHEIDAAERFFAKWGAQTAFFSRFIPIVRTFISFPAGIARMPIGKFVVYTAAGAFIWSVALVYGGTLLGENWVDIRHALQPFDTVILVVAVIAVAAFIWWRVGMPGRRGGKPTAS